MPPPPLLARRSLAGGACLLLGGAAAARAEAADDDAVRLSVRCDAAPDGPLVQEMVCITVQAIFRGQPNQVTLAAPAFVDARWVALGADAWSRVSLGGPDRVMLRRRLAWFAQRSGTLRVGAFVLTATVLDARLARVTVTRRTAPFALAVRPAPPGAPAWWLPARAVGLTQTFSQAPDRLGPGQVTRRTVTIQAEGIEAAQLPPLPAPDIPGVIAFARPVVSQTISAAGGLSARTTYTWDIEPVGEAPALLPEIRVPWFDTRDRTRREAVLPPVRIGLAGAAAPAAMVRPAPLVTPADLTAAAVAFLLTSAALQAPRLDRCRAIWERLRLAARVWRAARRGDPRALRRLLAGPTAPDSATIRDTIAALDRHLYASPPAPMPPLGGPLLRGIAWAILRDPRTRGSASTPDGAMPPNRA